MRSILKVSLASLAAIGSVALASAASANCGDTASLTHASYLVGSGDRPFRTADDSPGIVGMWRVQFFIGSNQIDFGYAQWHADGTEFMNSGSLNPAGQNYCLGVWQKTGSMSYHLNHFAFGYVPQITNPDNSPAIHINPALNVNIKEDVMLDSKGANYGGTFTIDFYDFKTNALVNHVAGRVTGQRVSAF